MAKYHHGNLKPALIEAGLDILREKGLAGISLRAIAERVGVSHTAPKNHFGNLAGLLTAIAAQGYERLTDSMRSGLTDDADRAERREAALTGYVRFATDNPALFELMFSRQKINRDDAEYLASATRSFEVLREASAGLVWDKSDLPDAALRAQVMHWSLVHGFAQLCVSGKLDKDAFRDLGILDVFPRFDYRDPD